MICKLPPCDVILKTGQKSYCCRKHHIDHQRLLRSTHRTEVKGQPNYSLIDYDLADKFAAIDERIMEELYEENGIEE